VRERQQALRKSGRDELCLRTRLPLNVGGVAESS